MAKTKILVKNSIIILIIFNVLAGFKIPFKVNSEISTGTLSTGVDYYWVNSVNKGDTVLISIQPTFSGWWYSRLYYSNLTLIQEVYAYGIHYHEFVADKADNYLIRVTATNYTIQCDHTLYAQPMHVIHWNLSTGVDYYWVNSVNKGDTVLISIQPTFSGWWYSRLYYSNLTLIQEVYAYGIHYHEFVADKADNYLIRVTATNYTIQCDHTLSRQMARYQSDISCFISMSEVNKGDAVTISGTISPTVQGLVTIQYSMDNGLTWINLTSLTSSSDGSYSYSWSPTDISSYRVRSLWQGNSYYNGAISQEAPFTVKQQDYTIVAVAAVTGVTAVGVAAAYKAGIIGTTKTTTLLKVYAAGTITAEAAPKIKARYKAWKLSKGENNVTDEVLEAEFKKADNIHKMLKEQGEKFNAEDCAQKLYLDVMEVKKALEILQVEGFVKTGSPPVRETVPYRGT